jgi:hypothetical protein
LSPGDLYRRDVRARRWLVVLGAAVAVVWVAVGGWATHDLDEGADRLAVEADDAFAGTTLAEIAALDAAADARTKGAEAELVGFLRQPGQLPARFGTDGDDYVARYEVEGWGGADRTVDVRWALDGTTVTTGP